MLWPGVRACVLATPRSSLQAAAALPGTPVPADCCHRQGCMHAINPNPCPRVTERPAQLEAAPPVVHTAQYRGARVSHGRGAHMGPWAAARLPPAPTSEPHRSLLMQLRPLCPG